MPVDHAVVEFRPTDGTQVRTLSYETNLERLPKTEDATMLVPCHGYLETDHMGPKAAITHRPGETGDPPFEVSGNYFEAHETGENDHYDFDHDRWRDRRLELLPEPGYVKAWARDSDHDWQRLGHAEGVHRREFVHVDFMTELQYDRMDLPEVAREANKTILGYVFTDEGWQRPADCLVVNGTQQGAFARIDHAQDSWGRFWFHHWVEPSTTPDDSV